MFVYMPSSGVSSHQLNREMGAGASRDQSGLSTQKCIRLLMPVYYQDDEPCVEDIALALRSWNCIVNNESEKYFKAAGSCTRSPSCLSWFFETFYERLFDVHPLSRQLFANTVNSQGKFLVMMISTSLKQLNDPAAFGLTMVDLARRHNQKGILANEYGIVGDVLFYSLEYCLDQDVYNRQTELAWLRIFSAMLRMILPEVLQHSASFIQMDQSSRDQHYLRASMSFQQSFSANNSSQSNPFASRCVSMRTSGGDQYKNFFLSEMNVENDMT